METPLRLALSAQLANQVQARDVSVARQTLHAHLNLIDGRVTDRLETLKLYAARLLSIAAMAADKAGATGSDLLAVNDALIPAMISAKTRGKLFTLIDETLARIIAMVPTPESEKEMRLADALEFIRHHCTEPISRKTVADLIGCSPTHVSRLFDRYVGKRFIDFLTDCRLEKAMTMLATTDRMITDIAFDVGYGDANYFAMLFRKHVGITPTQYRRKESACSP